MNNKPLILEIEEAKIEITQSINNAMQTHKLPCYIVDMILTDIKSQIKEGSRNELEMAKKQIATLKDIAVEPSNSDGNIDK